MAWEKGKADRPPAFNPFLASNNWVVAGSLTGTGKPILCNDPHLPLMAPPVWYEAHLVFRDSGGASMNVRGVTLPGVPFILTGRNQRISWGVTIVGADVIDFYRYDWSEDGTEYRNLDVWEKTTTITEKIRVKVDDGAKEREHKVSLTKHGPVLERDGERFAVRWLGHYPTMETLAFYGINTAKDIEEFKEALRYFHFPALNFVYADVDGNIAWWACGRYPIRSNVSEGDDCIEYRVPFNGSDGRGEWGDWDDPDAWVDPPDEVPHIVNPEAGYIATANNCPVPLGEFPHWLGWSWAESHRINRIVGMLKGTQPLDIDDMGRIQTDVYSIPAEKLVPHIVKACEERRLDDGVRGAVDALKEWDFEMDEDGVAPTIFTTWLDKFRNNAFPNVLDEVGLGDTPTTETIQRLLEQSSTAWSEFIGSGNENIGDVIVASLRDAVEQLREDHGRSMNGWRWGSVNHLYIEHPLGSTIPWFNYSRLPAGGWYNCVNPGGGRLVRYGTSWRQIIDLGDQRNSLCVLPGGQLGNPFSRHYRDQLGLWLEGKYKPMTMPESPEELEGTVSTINYEPKTHSP
ncbi:MAG: penicillin acylase family protein [Candidatus Bathyarchaeota archaeon]|nr:MAG: penicillin acylase family protein [Candidatus Bathyarchaeota archaeon]